MKRALTSLVLALLALSATLVGCDKTPDPTQLETTKLTEQMRVDAISDTLFFRRVSFIDEAGNDLIILCDEPRYVIRTDKDFNFINKIGHQGRAQNEYQFAAEMIVKDGDVYVLDYVTGLKKYTIEGKHIEDIKIPDDFYRSKSHCLIDGKIYSSLINKENGTTLARVDIGGEQIEAFGTYEDINYGHEMRTEHFNGGYLSAHSSDLIALRHERYIERYNKNLELTERYDLYSVPMVQEIIDRKMAECLGERIPTDENAFISLNNALATVVAKGDKLYIIYRPLDLNTKDTKILVVNVKGKIAPERIYHIEGTRFWKFAIDDDFLYACPAGGGEIVQYRLP